MAIAICPYCKTENTIKNMEDFKGEYSEAEIECNECYELFDATMVVTVTFKSKCKEIMHIYEPAIVSASRYEFCKNCDHSRIRGQNATSLSKKYKRK